MSDTAEPVTFLAVKKQELKEAFGAGWRTCRASPETAETSPFGACVEVEVDIGDKPDAPPRLRLVRDRGQSHVDVECEVGGGTKRWVSLEIVAVAIDPKLIGDYLRAFKATLAAPAAQAELPAMIDEPLPFIAGRKTELANAAADAPVIRETEARIAGKTTALLEAWRSQA